jgi:hypothetical protein
MKLPSSKRTRYLTQLLAAGTVVQLCAITLQSQPPSSKEVPLTSSSADYASAAAVQNQKIHAKPAHTAVAKVTTPAAISTSPNITAPLNPNTAPDSGGPRFPADLSYHGGNKA